GKRTKIVPSSIGQYLDAEALAYWIMCDGTKHSSGLELCTDSFTLEEVQLLISVLACPQSNFGLICSIHNKSNYNSDKVYHRIYIHKESMKLLNSLVLSHMLPEFHYKLHI